MDATGKELEASKVILDAVLVSPMYPASEHRSTLSCVQVHPGLLVIYCSGDF